MTKNRICATDEGLPAKITLSECQSNAVILAEMVDGIDLMANEGKRFDSARIAVTVAALERANRLASDLEALL